jgi:two-component system chemotaxis sensor kinase CheA
MITLAEIQGSIAELEAEKSPTAGQETVYQALRDICANELTCPDPLFASKISDMIDGLSRALSQNPAPAAAPQAEAEEPDPAVDPELVARFAAEAAERYARAQELILRLEQNMADREAIAELFRIFHTIKGECGFLKIGNLGELSHNVENLLVLLRDGKLEADARIVDLLLEGLDYSQEILTELRQGKLVLSGGKPLDPYYAELSEVTARVKPSLGEILMQKGKVSETELKEIVAEQAQSGFTKKLGEIAVERKLVTEEELSETLALQKKIERKEEGAPKTEKVEQIIKVKTGKVNYLVDMIGELTIALGQVNDSGPAMAQVRKITRTLQYAAMQLRTDGVKNLFGNVRRIVRDTSHKLNKPIVMETFGEDLEIDRNLLESLEEPLMHIVRNSVDHGVESAEARLAAGKPAEGKLTIGAERRGNNIVISVADDGAGLNREKILKKAVEKGLVKAEDAPAMTDDAVNALIFMPGFSTKEKIDYVSGRGVGMDIVHSAVQAAKGRIELESVPGKGLTTRLFFPLSTAIIDGMLVRSGANALIVPVGSIIESVKFKPGMVERPKQGVEVVRIREEIIPVIRVAQALGIPGAGAQDIGVIVEDSSKRRFALAVDEIQAKREVVIKSLGSKFKNLRGISSGTVLPGGKIGLVLDVDQVIALSEEGR